MDSMATLLSRTKHLLLRLVNVVLMEIQTRDIPVSK